MRNRTLLILALLIVSVVAVPLVFSARSDRRSETGLSSEQPATRKKSTRPVIVVKDRTFDLGLMNPGDRRTHRFRVENHGSDDLTLELASTTCKCTLATLSDLRIPPGGFDFVELEWHAERPQFRFRQGATIKTNDPDIPLMELFGEGSVRMKLGTLPEDPFLADVPRNTTRTLSVLLYSQAFSDVEVRRLDASSPTVRAELKPAGSQIAPPPESRFVRDLVITVGPQPQAGKFTEQVRVDYAAKSPDGKPETGTLEIPITFEVVGDYSFHGRDLIGKQLLFGIVPQAKGAKKQAYLHVRGAKIDDLKITPLRTEPDFLRVEVGTPQQLTPTIARYPITVEIPPNSPTVNRLDDEAAQIELQTTQSDHPTVRFSASFVVSP